MLLRDSHKLFCHLLHLLIRIYVVFIFPNLQSHAQDAASVKAGLLANTVNEFSTAKMSMVFFYLLRKRLIYLVQLPWVIFMEMSEQQSGEVNSNKDDCWKGRENTPLACCSPFTVQDSILRGGREQTVPPCILSKGQLHS